jgi:hypothetical protein
MPGFRPRREYLREMVRYGALPGDFDFGSDRADPYKLDERYFRLFYPSARTR